MRSRALLLAIGLAGGASVALPGLDDPAAWRFVGIAGKVPTRLEWVEIDGAPALRVAADSSYGNLVHELPGGAAAGTLQWQWRVDRLNEAGDLRHRQGDDTSLKVCALFDLPIDRVPFAERQWLRMARTVSNEPLPAASVCYVWDARLAQGTTLDNAFSRRVRYVVARSGSAPLHQWLDERHDLAADFARVFGDESPQHVPPLAAVAIGADADNTHGHSLGYVRAVRVAVP